jgi:predicted amidophosphoribosyltransferase
LLTRPHLAAPRRFPVGFPPTVAAGAYEGPVRAAVLAFKERGRAELGRVLGTALALAVAGVLAGAPGPAPVLLVPVPPSAAGLRARGRDHVRELTRCAVTELRAAGVPAAEARLLRRRGRVRDSAGLSAAQRRANLAGTFVPAGAAPSRGLLVLVDDVVSSGATLTEAASVFARTRSAHATPVLAAVVAATPRRDPPGPARTRPSDERGVSHDRLS